MSLESDRIPLQEPVFSIKVCYLKTNKLLLAKLMNKAIKLTDVVYILGSREGVLDGAAGKLRTALQCITDLVAGGARLISLPKFLEALVGRSTRLISLLDLFVDEI